MKLLEICILGILHTWKKQEICPKFEEGNMKRDDFRVKA
jgi:hypothetical protein